MDKKSKTIKLLPFEDLIKAFKEKGIEYDEREIGDAYFPLKDVEACMDAGIPEIMNKRMESLKNHRPCPLCGKPSEELKWIYFNSPQWNWDKLMGRCGPMSICPDCGCIVEFKCFLMN